VAELVGMFVLGLVFGGLIVGAWKSDTQHVSDPHEHGRNPL
jgi:hypothetical protein